MAIDFGVAPSIRARMANDVVPSPLSIIETLLLTAGFLMEEASAELALQVLPARAVLQSRIELVERTASELMTLAATARALLRMAEES